MKKVLSLMLAGIALLANQSHSVTFFADNFEAAGAGGATNLGAPWEMSKFVYTSTGDYVGHYAPGSTFGPNAIVSGQGGVDQGLYQGKLWPDYDGWWGDWTGNKVVKTSLLISIAGLTAQDIAPGTIQMDFDFKLQPTIGPDARAYSFARILSANWADTYWTDWRELTGGDWSHGSNKLTFDGNQVGLNVQYGFMVVSSNYQPNGLFIDNVTISNVPEPTSASLLGLGLAGLLASRLRRRS